MSSRPRPPANTACPTYPCVMLAIAVARPVPDVGALFMRRSYDRPATRFAPDCVCAVAVLAANAIKSANGVFPMRRVATSLGRVNDLSANDGHHDACLADGRRRDGGEVAVDHDEVRQLAAGERTLVILLER